MDAPWRIEMLGTLCATLGDRVVTRFRSRKIASLLAYLAYHRPHAYSRDVIIESLWPECELDVGRNRLRVSLTSLRHQLEPPGVLTGAVLLADRVTLQLNPVAAVTDVAEFEAALHAASRTASPTEHIQHLTGAVELYCGELLPGLFDDWILPERQRLADVFFQAQSQLIGLLAQAGDLSRALHWAQRAVWVDPLREEGRRDLMRLLAAAGQPEAALRQYGELKRLLEAELGAAPEPESQALAHELAALVGQRQAESAESTAGGHLHRVTRPAESRGIPRGRGSEIPLSSPTSLLSLPTGTVTFLLTELLNEGSLRDRAETGFAAALQSYHELLRPLLRGHGGHELQVNVELLHVVFGRASDALAASVFAQRALATHAWPSDAGAPRVRMALHTGEVAPVENACASPALRTATRLLLAAHAGQILLSGATAGLMPSFPETGVRLVDLGSYRLPGGGLEGALEVPAERLFQVHDPQLAPREFPPPNAIPAQTGNLPLQFTRFFGREEEIAHLRELLLTPETHLVTLTGPGGTGKTRLAQEAAMHLREPLRRAIWFVPLEDLSDAARIVDKVLDALRLARSPGIEPLEQAVGALSRQPALLLLDNFEHLAPTGAPLVRTLLERVPTLTCLVTSRQRLDLAGEREFLVAPLPTPELTDTPEELTRCASVQLFVDRAQAVRPDFQVTRGNAAVVAALCQRLEGIPLALELAAARAAVLSPGQMLARLMDRYEFLVSRQRGATPRHRSLRAAIGWSYELLAPELQRFFRQLCVFRGGWTPAAAEAVCEEPRALEYLERLRERSLIILGEQGVQARYRLLETLREYADEQLTAEERTALKRRHADYYRLLAEAAEPQFQGPEQKEWLDRLEAEHNNLRAALEWCEIDPEEEEPGLRLAAALGPFCMVRGYLAEGRERLANLLARAGALAPTASRAKALDAAGVLAMFQGDYKAARSLYEQSLAIQRELDDASGLATALFRLGMVANIQGDYKAARSFCEQSLAIRRKLGDKVGIADCLLYLGEIGTFQGDHGAAGLLLEDSLRLHRELGNKRGIAWSLYFLGTLARYQGNWEAARARFEECVRMERELQFKKSLAYALGGLGFVAVGQGDVEEARRLHEESLILQREIGDKRGSTESLGGLARVAIAQGQAERAGRLFGAAQAVREAVGIALPPAERAEYEAQVTATRTALGKEAFAAAWASGREMTLEEAICVALAEDEIPTRKPPRGNPGGMAPKVRTTTPHR